MLVKQAYQKVLEDRQRIEENSFKNVARRQNAHLGSIYIPLILLLYKLYILLFFKYIIRQQLDSDSNIMGVLGRKRHENRKSEQRYIKPIQYDAFAPFQVNKRRLGKIQILCQIYIDRHPSIFENSVVGLQQSTLINSQMQDLYQSIINEINGYNTNPNIFLNSYYANMMMAVQLLNKQLQNIISTKIEQDVFFIKKGHLCLMLYISKIFLLIKFIQQNQASDLIFETSPNLTYAYFLNSDGQVIQLLTFAFDDDNINLILIFNNYFIHQKWQNLYTSYLFYSKSLMMLQLLVWNYAPQFNKKSVYLSQKFKPRQIVNLIDMFQYPIRTCYGQIKTNLRQNLSFHILDVDLSKSLDFGTLQTSSYFEAIYKELMPSNWNFYLEMDVLKLYKIPIYDVDSQEQSFWFQLEFVVNLNQPIHQNRFIIQVLYSSTQIISFSKKIINVKKGFRTYLTRQAQQVY
ncbi:hypothetical protein pb186bvf_013807 [Paramecium bursaria]